MIKSIVHLSDIHIRKATNRHEEYCEVFEKLYESLSKTSPDRIVIVGDLFHDFLDLQSEQLILAANFLTNLSEIAKVVIIRGNHDIRKSHLSRIDCIQAIVEILNNPNILYLNETDFFEDENVVWAVWKHGEKNNNPWLRHKKYKKNEGKTYIDLFHDPITGSKSTSGFEFDSKTYYKISDFKSDYGFYGDIHLQQFLDKNHTKAYSGSLIAQDFSEGDSSFHGYLLWNIQDKTVKEVPIYNNYSFKSMVVNPYTNFSELDFEIENPTPYMRMRVIWRTLPASKTKENERHISDYLKSKYGDCVISLAHKSEFLEQDKLDVIQNETLLNINDKAVQHAIFTDYLKKIGVDEETNKQILELNDEIGNRLETVDEITNIEWDVLRLKAKNFMSYEDIEINWDGMDGIYQIIGQNTAGKTTFLKILTYILFSKTIETETKQKFGDKRYINDKIDVNFCEAEAVISANQKFYGIRRRTVINKNKSGEITGAPTTVNYYLLKNSNDELNDDNKIDKLNDEDRNRTQKQIETIIGTYDNFLRCSLTTGDHINNILSNDQAVFIDSILYDASLDLFDKKLEIFKEYQKDINSKFRITCNVENTKSNINEIEENNKLLNSEIDDINVNKLPELKNRIVKGNEYVENQVKSLNKIDDEIYNLNIDDTRRNIKLYGDNINDLKGKKIAYEENMKLLPESYNEKELEELIEIKEKHKEKENLLKLQIKDILRKISDEDHKIEIENGKIFTVKKEGSKLREDLNDKKNYLVRLNEQIVEKNDEKTQLNKELIEKESELDNLLKSKICPLCGQDLDVDHLTEEIQKLIDNKLNNLKNNISVIKNNIINNGNKTIALNNDIEATNNKISTINDEMVTKGKEIKIIENKTIPTIKIIISNYNDDINKINSNINSLTVEMELTLKKIGELTNQKNDVEKRKNIQNEIDKIPILIENDQLKIDAHQNKIDKYNNSLVQIEENKNIENKIKAGKELLKALEIELENLNKELNNKNNSIIMNNSKIEELTNLIKNFQEQEKRDEMFELYKKLINRNGIPRQLLVNNIIPRINAYLSELLSNVDFKVWLDVEDLRLKLAYYNNLDAIIDAISGSGKERTLAAIALKYSLIQINTRSKSSLFILDEVMGKLIGNSVSEFNEIIQAIKTKMRRVIIIEHNHEVSPDYIISIFKDERGVSTLSIE